MEQQVPDPDLGLELRPEIANYLRKPSGQKERSGRWRMSEKS
jgi:hypothetical protein